MSFKAYTFNVQHGEGTDGVTNYQRQIDAMVGDLFAIQERSHPDTGWDTPMSTAGLAQAIYRPNQIGGGDGNAIWYKSSTVTILNTYECQLSVGATSPWDGGTNVDKCAVAAKVQVEGQKFFFVNTHLCQNAGADADQSLFSAIREGQFRTLLDFMDDNLLGLDIALAADLNCNYNYLLANGAGRQLDLLSRAGFVDCWRVGMANGTATAPWANLDNSGGADQIVSENIITHDTRPYIDAIWLKTVNRALTMTAVSVPDMRVTCSVPLEGSPLYCPDVAVGQRNGNMLDWGVRPTDHNPVWAEFSVNQTAASPVRRSTFSWFPNVRL